MSLYNKKEWKEYRDNVLESDDYKCVRCGRGIDEVVLQVHHKIYLTGKLPWEYATRHCETLCKGCHAEEHGKIRPKIGWEYVCDEDLGDLIGTCENCRTSIRYVYHIGQKNWGFLAVGTLCCDNLTATEIASNKREAQNRYRSRKARFIKSKRWKYEFNRYSIKQSLFEVSIRQKGKNNYELTIHDLRSDTQYETLESAKESAFDAIESGSLYEYLDKKNMEYPKKKKK